MNSVTSWGFATAISGVIGIWAPAAEAAVTGFAFHFSLAFVRPRRILCSYGRRQPDDKKHHHGS
jgi:hypothetical protein